MRTRGAGPDRWKRLRALANGLALLMAFASAGFAQAPNGDVGLITYAIPSSRAPDFERALDRAIQVMKAGNPPGRPAPAVGLRVYRASPVAPDSVIFMILVDPMPPDGRPSIEDMLRALGTPEAADALRTFALAAGSVAPYRSVFTLLESVSPADALRSQLDSALSGQLDPAGRGAHDPPPDRRELDRIQQPLCAVDGLRYEVVNRSAASWRFRWSATVRNPSLMQPVGATVTVQFLDSAANVVGSSPPVDVRLDAVGERQVSGEVSIDAGAAARVVNAAARVSPRP